jgi:hypothetical protein
VLFGIHVANRESNHLTPEIESMQDFPANPMDKPGYNLAWNDEFESPELDTSKWLPYYLPHWSSRERSILTFM